MPSVILGRTEANGRSVDRHMTERFVEAERHMTVI